MKCLDTVEALIKNCKVDAALKELEPILLEEPDNAEARILFGVCRQMQGRTEEFCQVYRDLAPTLSARESAGDDSPVVARWRHFCKVASYLISLGLVTLVGGSLQVVHADTIPPAVETRVFSIEEELEKPEFEPLLDGTTNLVQVSRGYDEQLVVVRVMATFDFTDEDEDKIDAARREARFLAYKMILKATNSSRRRLKPRHIQLARSQIQRKGQGGVVVAYYYYNSADAKPSEDTEVYSRYNMGGRPMTKYNMGGSKYAMGGDWDF